MPTGSGSRSVPLEFLVGFIFGSCFSGLLVFNDAELSAGEVQPFWAVFVEHVGYRALRYTCRPGKVCLAV